MRYYSGFKMHVQRKGLRVEWWVHHSGYGSAGGYEWTHGGARRAAFYAIGDFVQGVT